MRLHILFSPMSKGPYYNAHRWCDEPGASTPQPFLLTRLARRDSYGPQRPQPHVLNAPTAGISWLTGKPPSVSEGATKPSIFEAMPSPYPDCYYPGAAINRRRKRFQPVISQMRSDGTEKDMVEKKGPLGNLDIIHRCNGFPGAWLLSLNNTRQTLASQILRWKG